MGKYDEAIRLGKLALELNKKIYGENHDAYATSLHNLATFYCNTNNNEESIHLATKALEIRKNLLGENNPDYANTLQTLAMAYSNIGYHNQAIRLNKKATDIYKATFGDQSSEYAMALNNQAVFYSKLGNYSEAIRLSNIALGIQKKIIGENHHNCALSMSNIARYYSEICNYKETITLQAKVVEIYKNVYGDEHPKYADALEYLAYYYYITGNNTEAIKIATKSLEINKKTLGEHSHEYATSLNYLALYESAIGNYNEAIRLGTMALEIHKKNLGENHPDYASSLQNLAGYNYYIGNYDNAIKLGTEAAEIIKKVKGEDNASYALAIHNLAGYYDEIDSTNKAIELGSIALEIQKKVLGENNLDYAISLDNVSMCYASINKYDEALRLGYKALEIRKNVLGEDHTDYSRSLSHISRIEFDAGNYDVAQKLYTQAYKNISDIILNNFAAMTSMERANYWNLFSDFFNYLGIRYALNHPNETINSLAYNGQVLSKGLLLNTELEIQKLIETSGDTTLANLFYKTKNDRTMLDILLQTPKEKREMNADSLQKTIEQEELRLVQSSKEIGDYTKNLSINWTDVQQHLRDNYIAIEFASFKEKGSSDNQIYIALVLKKGMTAPELVKLNFSDTDTVDYTSHSLYIKIWKPLENHLQGVQNVYFSPTGKFHTIGIEYLSDDNGEIFAKKYNVYRLSSTRELALNHTVNQNKKASVFGGIVYDFDETDWQNVSEEEAERAGITFLKGAKKESEEITNILSENSFNVEYGTDKTATEESFKKLSGSGIKILHIATHGFYEPESKENSFADMLSSGDKNSKEDLSLSRSGLFFAGANTALDPEQRQFIPDGVDDGILTAKEISRMDFKGLDLVVMSACQTGLGEVTGEGVFGLQRGFKKAGAQTIIMSLWKVNDKPTKELMTEFYRNLVAGKSKREAFILAQDKIRLKYIDPKMWAGFIMVDGIE